MFTKKKPKNHPNKIIFKRAKKGFGYSAQVKKIMLQKRNIQKNEIILKKI